MRSGKRFARDMSLRSSQTSDISFKISYVDLKVSSFNWISTPVRLKSSSRSFDTESAMPSVSRPASSTICYSYIKIGDRSFLPVSAISLLGYICSSDHTFIQVGWMAYAIQLLILLWSLRDSHY